MLSHTTGYPQPETRNTSHTPGPWDRRGPSDGRLGDPGDYAIVADGHIIAEAYRRVGEQVFAPAMENARLIAAAPDYLAACTRQSDDVTALEWLSALLTEAEHDLLERNWLCDDHQAMCTAVRECGRLLDALKAATAKAQGQEVAP